MPSGRNRPPSETPPPRPSVSAPAILVGWDDDTLQEVAAKHRWDEHRVAYVRKMRGYLAPVTDPQPNTEETTT
ncbi:hypothetical protein [Streptomyces bluensis]|uniref:Uncharacterized protein n=1 Tax=Streptomyces bluensis TaxID=33897 RepID=A0ABW6UU14_9ACTN